MSNYDFYDSAYDFDSDGKLDAYEYTVMEDDDDDYYYRTHNMSSSSTSYSGSGRKYGGYSGFKSIIVGLLVTSVLLAIIGVDDPGYFGLFVWGLIAFGLYVGTNK